MLGSQILKITSKLKKKNLKFFYTSRKIAKDKIFFDVHKKKTYKNIEAIRPDYIINCIGLLKSRISKNTLENKKQLFRINSTFPMYLSKKFKNSKIIHISTDGIFDGFKGNYIEIDKPSANDIYGLSKIKGEISKKNVMNIRCSIIGLEKGTNYSILSWFLKNKSKQINGYNDQFWNGITTYALSKICIGVIEKDLFRNGSYHIFSKKKVSKYKLLCIFNKYLISKKKIIVSVKSGRPIDMTLSSINKKYILNIWKSAGYKSNPKIESLIKELI